MDLTALFCDVDDFVSKKEISTFQIKAIGENKAHRIRACTLSDSEIMTIIIAYHQSGYRNFKAFYIEYVRKHLDKYFPKLVSYNRFLELMSKVILLLTDYLAFRFCPASYICRRDCI